MRWGDAPYNIMHSQDVPPKHYRHDEGAKKKFTTVGSKKRSPREGCCKSARDNIYLVVAKFFVFVSLAWMLCKLSNCSACITPNEEHHSGNQAHFPSEGRSLSSFGAAYDGSDDSLCSKITDSLCGGSTDSLMSGGIASPLNGSTDSLRSGSSASPLKGSIDTLLSGSSASPLKGSIDTLLSGSSPSPLNESIDSLLSGSSASPLNRSIDSLLSGSSASPLNRSNDSLQRDVIRANQHLTLYYRIANSKKLQKLLDNILRRVKKNKIFRKIMDKAKKIWNSKPMKVVRFVVPFLPMISMIVAAITTLCMGLN
ncbi:hypothetical protein PCYB_021200, partial [Plasmodium cynomolgi strain B]